MFPRYDQIRTPVEIIHGTADIIVAAKTRADRLVQAVADANLTLLRGIGQGLHNVAMPDVIAAVDGRPGAPDCARDTNSHTGQTLDGAWHDPSL